MRTIPLKDLVDEKGLVHVAKALEVTPPAIHKAIATDRNILVTESPDGAIRAEEIKPFPSQKHKPAA